MFYIPKGDRCLLTFPVAPGTDAKKLIISTTGYTGMQKGIFQERIEKMGGVYTGRLTKDNTHLLCNSPTSEKSLAAARLKVQVVNHMWLIDSVLTSEWQSCDKYSRIAADTIVKAEWIAWADVQTVVPVVEDGVEQERLSLMTQQQAFEKEKKAFEERQKVLLENREKEQQERDRQGSERAKEEMCCHAELNRAWKQLRIREFQGALQHRAGAAEYACGKTANFALLFAQFDQQLASDNIQIQPSQKLKKKNMQQSNLEQESLFKKRRHSSNTDSRPPLSILAGDSHRGGTSYGGGGAGSYGNGAYHHGNNHRAGDTGSFHHAGMENERGMYGSAAPEADRYDGPYRHGKYPPALPPLPPQPLCWHPSRNTGIFQILTPDPHCPASQATATGEVILIIK